MEMDITRKKANKPNCRYHPHSCWRDWG